MKKNRKLTALLVAACMTIPMAATTFTVPMVASAGSIQINVSTEHQDEFDMVNYYAIQVFKGSVSGTGENAVFGVSGWGNFINHEQLVEDLAADSVIGTYFSDIDVSNTAASVAAKAADLEKIEDDTAKNAAKAAFSRVIAKNIILNNSDKDTAYKNASENHYNSASGNSTVTISGLETGYYIIVENYAPTYGESDVKTAKTLGILKVVDGAVTGINPKRSYPTVTKTVKEGDDNVYSSATDAQVGEIVDFKITCTLPDHLEYYEHYYLEINDILGKGFELQGDITVSGNAVKDKDYFITFTDSADSTKDTGVLIQFEDINRSGLNYVSGGTIDITYKARLTASGTGNNVFTATNPDPQENYVSVTYLSNPNATYTESINSTDSELQKPDVNDSVNEPNMSTSQGSIAKVYTYRLDIDKYKKDSADEKLLGAEFKLKNGSNQYVTVDTNGIVTGWDGTGSTLTTNGDGKASVIGLDKGTYYLEEIKAPDGYNKLTSDVDVVIDAVFSNSVLTELSLNGVANNGNLDTGTVTLGVPNAAGAQLPSTGGIGTKIFYILGGTLVIGSGAALVIKKRMGKDEE